MLNRLRRTSTGRTGAQGAAANTGAHMLQDQVHRVQNGSQQRYIKTGNTNAQGHQGNTGIHRMGLVEQR